jgi:hypothetical protein
MPSFGMYGVVGRKQTCWLRHYPSVTSLLQPIRDEKASNGSFFRVLFMYTSFPPKFELPISALPVCVPTTLSYTICISYIN